MKTIKQLADEIGISKQRLYRYIKKNHINDVHHDTVNDVPVIYIDDTLETLIKSHFLENCHINDVHHDTPSDTHHDVPSDTVFELLKMQLKEKDKQIEQLQELLKNQQILTHQANQKIELLETKKDAEHEEYHKTIFGLYRKKGKK